VLLAGGAIGWSAAWDEAGELAPTLAFLAALFALGEGCWASRRRASLIRAATR
jgi:hypothetical protein